MSPFTPEEQQELLLIIGIVLLLVAAGNLYVAIRNLLRARRSRRWPEAAGQVVGHALGRPKFRMGTFFVPQVRYEFEVGGKTFRNHDIWFGGYAPWGAEQARKICETYPVGSAVQVIYDPTRPETSALMRKGAIMMAMTYGITTLIVGLIFLMTWSMPA